VPYIQVPLLLAGLHFGIRGTYKAVRPLFSDERRLAYSMAPPVMLSTLVTVGMLRLFVG